MNRFKKLLFVSILTLGTIFVLPAVTTFDSDCEIRNDVELSDNSCKLHLKTSYGSAAKSVKVSTDVSGGISCSGGRSFYTDSSGEVILKWVSGCYLKRIYIEGKPYDVDFRDGEIYEITMK